MGQHRFNHATQRKSFTSASTTGCNDAMQISKVNCNFGRGNSSKSFHNFGRNHRISYYIGHKHRNYGDCGLDMGALPSCGFGWQASGKPSYKNEGLFQVSINKHLLEPLYLGVDPHDHQVKAREKEQMKDLNTQFACFIDKVRYLEQKNQMLVTKWELLQTQKIPTVKKDLNPLCENYICKLRQKLECMLCDKNKLINQHKTMQSLIEENRCKFEDEVHMRAQAENEFVLLKQKVDNAFKHQKEMELKKELLVENKEFLKNFFTEELAVLDCHLRDTSVVVNMNNSRCLNMDDLIQNIDGWYHSIAERSKEEANLFYQNKIEDLQNKQCQHHENLKKNVAEIVELNRLIQIIQCQLDTEKKKVAVLQAAIEKTKQNGDSALKDAREKDVELQNRLQNSKDKLASILRDYQDLMNTKLALDIEIATYKTMLEGEENRICTGAPVSLAVRSTATAFRKV